MLHVYEKAPEGAAPSGTLTLSYEERTKSRKRLTLDDGEAIALMLPRGSVLSEGERLRLEDGRVILVRAKPEPLSLIEADDPWLLARGAYHLGNRHVAVEVRRGSLRYPPDHVLDAMMLRLGFDVQRIEGVFTPEAGAYGHGH